jgi:hypothetical protein
MGLFVFQSSINSFWKQEKNYGELLLNEYNQPMVIEEMQRVMEQVVGFQAGTKLLVGVSGGPDSLTLLNGLFHLGYSVTPPITTTGFVRMPAGMRCECSRCPSKWEFHM